MSELDTGVLETVPQNLFGVNPVARPRPYLSSTEEQQRYMRFMGYERGVLTARIAELNSRAEQILYIYLCRKSESYLSVADRSISTARHADSYFYEWLDELAVQGVAYATKRNSSTMGKTIYRWDEIQKVIELCLSKGISEEIAAKVASVGVRAVASYLKYGVVSLDDMVESKSTSGDTVLPEVEEARIAKEAAILEELASATSSRDASITARERIGTDYVRVSAINKDEDHQDIPDFTRYNVEIQVVQRGTGEYTPYEARVYFKTDTPIMAVKFALAKWSEALSRIV